MYHFKIWMSVNLINQRTTVSWKTLWKWIKLQIWIFNQLGFSWMSHQLSREVVLWCFVFGAVALRSSGALPIMTHRCIWTQGDEVKGEKGFVHVWVCAQCNLRHTMKQGRLSCTVTGEEKLFGRWLATMANHRGTGGAIVYMAKIAGTLTCEMYRVTCYKHPSQSPQKRKASKVTHRHRQLQVVALDSVLLKSWGVCTSHALHPCWQAAPGELLFKSHCFFQHTERNRCLWYAVGSVTSQHKTTCSTLDGSIPFMGGSGAAGLEMQG